MEPNARHCQPSPPSPLPPPPPPPPPQPSSSSSSAVINSSELMAVSTSTTRSASASPKIPTNFSAETPSRRTRSAGLRKSRTATPTSDGSKLKLRQATSDAIPSQSERLRNSINKENTITGDEVHRLQLRHANSELATESSSIGDCLPNTAVRTSSNFYECSLQPRTNDASYPETGLASATKAAVASTNSSNRSLYGRHIESGGRGGGIEITTRPQSALATMRSSKSPEPNNGSSRAESLQQQQKQQSQHQYQHPNTNINTNPRPYPPRSKTTRVRINSTSEQIQDPNWLIQMSKELELQQQQQRQKKSHLKLLHRKLKSTIIGHHHHQSNSSTTKDFSIDASYSNSDAQILGPTITTTATTTPPNNANEIGSSVAQDKSPISTLTGGAFSPPLLPPTPVKVPVSILKQRTLNATNTTSSTNNSPAFNQHQQQQQFFKIPSQTSRTKSPVPNQQPALASVARPVTVGKSTKQSANKQHKQSLQQQHKPQAAPSISSPTVTFQTDTNKDSPSGCSQQHKASQQEPNLVTPKTTPICADGQVKVSGWKRNNLLAKTLSHFDEIRGNQRPIFVPTKIMLPTEAIGQNKHQILTTATTTTASQSPANLASFKPGKSKFAEIVREAVSKKNQLINSSKQISDIPTNICQSTSNQQQDPHQGQNIFQEGASNSSKRSSYCLGTKDFTNEGNNEIMQLYNQHHVSTRAISAEPSIHSSSNLHQMVGDQAGSLQQHRSSSTGTRESFSHTTCSGSPTTSHIHGNLNVQSSKQQVTSIAKKHSSSGASVSGNSPANSHSTLHVSPQLVSQLLMSHAATSALSEASSSRSFKLQHKNQQVLQNLKHQLDPESSSHPHQHNQSGTYHHSSNSTHIKDWKRLTSKLSLLTSSRNFKSSSSSGNSPSSNKNLPTVKDDSVLLGGSNNKSGNPIPLRLTVSNQESGKSCGSSQEGSDERHPPGPFSLRFRQKRNSNSNSNQNNSPSSVLQVPESSGPRKLSSSSMVVQSTTTSSDSNKTGSNNGISTIIDGTRDTQTTCRRSSDSEAYRVPCSNYIQARQHEASGESRGSAISLQSNTSNNSSNGNKQPIVVHRNDLLQILQVASRPRQRQQQRGTANDSSGYEYSNLNGSIKDKEHRHSLQLSAASSSQVMTQDKGGGGKTEQTQGDKIELIRPDEANIEYRRERESMPCMGRSISLNSVEIRLASDGQSTIEDKQFKMMAVRNSLSDTPSSSVTSATKICRKTTTVSTSLFSPKLRPDAVVRDGNSKEELNDDNAGAGASVDANAADSNGDHENQAANSAPLLQRSADLSWVVKKTSKVAFFQQKLRKMRWHSKQRKNPAENPEMSEAASKNAAVQQQQIAAVNNNKQQQQQGKLCPSVTKKGTSNDEDTNENENRNEGENDLGTGPSEVFMDPTLIGDAIEIFLRNTMQQQQEQKQLYQLQKRPHRRESTGEIGKEGETPDSEIDRRISLSIEASLIEPSSLSSEKLQSGVISSSNKPSSTTQANVPPQEAKLCS